MSDDLNPYKFRQMFAGEWSEPDWRAAYAACWYILKTETFDREVSPPDGRPMNLVERRIMSNHAARKARRLKRAGVWERSRRIRRELEALPLERTRQEKTKALHSLSEEDVEVLERFGLISHKDLRALEAADE